LITIDIEIKKNREEQIASIDKEYSVSKKKIVSQTAVSNSAAKSTISGLLLTGFTYHRFPIHAFTIMCLQ
jgi:hypothetical protein